MRTYNSKQFIPHISVPMKIKREGRLGHSLLLIVSEAGALADLIRMYLQSGHPAAKIVYG